jgi:SAM-dependent methyltransferase
MVLADMGAGTGRFSIPLAIRGCRVVGVDISSGMLHIMLSKLNPESRSRLQPIAADAEWFPLRPSSFDAVVCFQLLHLIKDWRSVIKEVQRTLVKGGLLALGESVGGGFQAEVIDAYKDIRAKHGYPYKRLGAGSLREVLDYLRGEGYSASSDPDVHNWVGHMTIDSIIQGMEEKVYSRTLDVPQDVHREIVLELREWARKRYNNLELPRETESEFKVGFANLREGGRKK